MSQPTRKRSSRPPSRRSPSRDIWVGAYDVSLKHLLHKGPEEFISFALRQDQVRVLRPIEGAVPALGRELDGGYRVLWQGQEVVVHLEFHRRHQGRDLLAQDVLEAQVRLFRREGVKVLSLVFDLYGSEDEAALSDQELGFGVPLAQGAASRCMYRRVNLRGMDWQELLALPLTVLWPLVPLSRGGTGQQALREASDAIEKLPALGPADRADRLAVLCFLAEAQDHVAAAALRDYVTLERLMKSTLYETIIEKGIERGIEKGEKKGLLLSIREIWSNRFGPMPEDVSHRLEAAPEPGRLRQAISAILRAGSEAEARAQIATLCPSA